MLGLHVVVKGASKQFKSDIQDEYLFNGMGSRIEGDAAPCDAHDTWVADVSVWRKQNKTAFQCGENRTRQNRLDA